MSDLRRLISNLTPHYKREQYELTRADYEQGYAWVRGKKYPIQPGQRYIEWCTLGEQPAVTGYRN